LSNVDASLLIRMQLFPYDNEINKNHSANQVGRNEKSVPLVYRV